jgi:putative aldouronate transport system substrate-binding protein
MGVVDPTVVLPEFQQALKAAGIEEIIAENQKQIDEWRAEQ